MDRPSKDWLGNWSNRELELQSGLWNQQHVDDDHDPRLLDILEDHVRQT